MITKTSWSKSLALAILGLATAAIGLAQGNVQGTVSDPLGARVPNVKVTLQQGEKSAGTATSDSNGLFSISSVGAGRYRVHAEAPGFESYTGPEISIGSGGTDNADVLLQVGSIKQEVVVSATGSELPVAQTGASVSLIDSETIQSQNKLDVLEDLRQVSGVQVVQTSQRGGTTSLFIRGGESNFNKVLVDGVPVNAIGGGFDYAQLSNSGVQSVEVLSGANSVLFGSDALAGVVNVTTRRGITSLPELRLSFDGGNFGTMDQNASFSGVIRRFDYFSEYSRFDTDGSYPNNFFHNATYAGNFGYALNSKTELRATIRRTWTGLGSPNGIGLFGISDDSVQKNQNTYASATAQNQTTKRWHNLVRFGFSQANSTYSNPSPTGQPDTNGFGDFLGKLTTIKGANGYSVTGQGILDFGGSYPEVFPSYEARHSFYGQSDYQFFQDWTGTFGFRYEHQNSSGFTRDNYGYFTEGHGSIGRRFYVTAGVGVENNQVFGLAATPRVSLAYYVRRPTSGTVWGETKLRFNFGKGIKDTGTYQQAHQLFALLTPVQIAQFKVGEIGPERSRAIDVGIDQGLARGRARLQITFFQNRFYDLITSLSQSNLIAIGVPAGAAAAAQFGAYVNATSTSSKGVETQFLTDLGHGLHFQANYTYLDPVVTKAFGTPSFNPAIPGIPIGAYSPLQGAMPFRRARHTGSIALMYSSRKFTGTFSGYMVGKRDDSTFLSDQFFGNTLLLPNHNLAASYQKFDASIRYALKPFVSLYTSMENLFDRKYEAAFGFPATPFAIRAGVTFTIGGEAWRK